MEEKELHLTREMMERFAVYMGEQERARSTIQKYMHDLQVFYGFLNGEILTKQKLIEWKGHLTEMYAPASVNSMLAAVNSFLVFMGWRNLMVKPLKIQKPLFLDEQKELTRAEYVKLVKAAEAGANLRLSLVIQTICATGIRVSELRYITVEAVQKGRAEIINKGKRRMVFLPDKLRRALRKYVQKQKRTAGAVFVTRSGKALDRSNIWRDMKALCERAGVDAAKVFPHNLRHLFARTYYSLQKDLSRLADILGHTNINTTRIYTAESGVIHAKQIDGLALVVT